MITQRHYNQVEYLKSANALSQMPSDKGIEVAFIGRSNAGKSSALNAITGIKGLARTSATPGRTQMINVFTLDQDRRLIDLPGYGYAKVPKRIQQRWEEYTDQYLQTRRCLRGLVLVMDIRHPLKEMDRQVIAWTTSCGVPLLILLTKSDKLSRGTATRTLKEVREHLEVYGDQVDLQVFSSLDGRGVEEAKQCLNRWFMNDTLA